MSARPTTSRVEPTIHMDSSGAPVHAGSTLNLYAAPSVRVADTEEIPDDVTRTIPTIAQRIIFFGIAAYSVLMVAMVGYFLVRQFVATATLPSLLGKLFSLWIICSAYFYPLRSVWRAIKGSFNGSREGALKACGAVLGSFALLIAFVEAIEPTGGVLKAAVGLVIMTIPHIAAVLMLCLSRIPDPRRLRWMEPSERTPL
ncbi:hypothetical protein [Niveibacterium sp.]|uniref:hypothetical protein n=1 Tax=Niveibacterium sp. TaxID=2017444 RepID=UPI0035B3FCC2